SIVEDLATQWTDYQRPGAPDLYPEALRAEIDEINDRVFRTVNNGVYRAGLTGSQEVYEKAFNELFATLDWLEERLSTRRYHVGGCVPLPHPGSLRHGLSQPLQVQSKQDLGDAEPVGLPPRSFPDAGLRRQHELPANQGPLLPGAHGYQSHRRGPGRPKPGELLHRAWSRGAPGHPVRQGHRPGRSPG